MKSVRLYLPHLVVFVSSMGVMIIELVASRLVSKYFGSSLYTWTGIIGVVLGGISLGNYLGGRLADRFAARKIIAILLLSASLLCFLILLLDMVLYRIMDIAVFASVNSGMLLRSFVFIIFLFLLPSTALGTISPVMAKLALQSSDRVGNTVGSIYAVSAIGSIVGTFLSGYLLIPLLGINTIIVVVAALLAFLALLMGRWRALTLGWILLIGASFVLVRQTASNDSWLYPDPEGSFLLYRSDSRYSHIEVRELERASRSERILIQDALIHNRYDPSAPDDLLYEYEQIFAALTRRIVQGLPAGCKPRTLTLGGGGCVFPLYLERRYPGSKNVVVEIDGEVYSVAHLYFDLPCDSSMERVVADARLYVQSLAGRRKFDLIYLDAFNSFSIPFHLTTVEFNRQIASLLAPGAVVMVNCIDIYDLGGFLNAYLNTLGSVFENVQVYTHSGFSSRRRATFVILAGSAEIHGQEPYLYDEAGNIAGRRLDDELLAELRERNGDTQLTDDYAPVENLIAPVFLRAVD